MKRKLLVADQDDEQKRKKQRDEEITNSDVTMDTGDDAMEIDEWKSLAPLPNTPPNMLDSWMSFYNNNGYKLPHLYRFTNEDESYSPPCPGISPSRKD